MLKVEGMNSPMREDEVFGRQRCSRQMFASRSCRARRAGEMRPFQLEQRNERREACIGSCYEWSNCDLQKRVDQEISTRGSWNEEEMSGTSTNLNSDAISPLGLEADLLVQCPIFLLMS